MASNTILHHQLDDPQSPTTIKNRLSSLSTINSPDVTSAHSEDVNLSSF